jgi:hypothetical protein
MTMMKKGNVTILASILAIALVAAGVGAGTMAWFSTTPVGTYYATMNAATMSMGGVQLGPWTFNNLKPGDEFKITIELSNTGTMDIAYLGTDWVIGGIDWSTNPTLDPTIMEFASKVEVTHMWERVSGTWRDSMAPDQNYWNLVGDYAMPLTLLELAQSYWGTEPAWASGRKRDQFGGWVGFTTDAITGSGYDVTPGPALPYLGLNYQMELDLKFSTTAGNGLQGKTLQFYVVFTGTQDTSTVP